HAIAPPDAMTQSKPARGRAARPRDRASKSENGAPGEGWEDAPAGLFLARTDGRVVRANREFARMLGYASAEDATQAVVPVGEGIREVPITRADGTTFWGICSERRGEREAEGLVRGILVDATALRAAGALGLRDQKMEAIGRLAGGIAHDFNN